MSILNNDVFSLFLVLSGLQNQVPSPYGVRQLDGFTRDMFPRLENNVEIVNKSVAIITL